MEKVFIVVGCSGHLHVRVCVCVCSHPQAELHNEAEEDTAFNYTGCQ